MVAAVTINVIDYLLRGRQSPKRQSSDWVDGRRKLRQIFRASQGNLEFQCILIMCSLPHFCVTLQVLVFAFMQQNYVKHLKSRGPKDLYKLSN